MAARRDEIMDSAELDHSQPIGLDIGTSRIVVARGNGKKYQYDTQLNAFITLPYSELTESLLHRENVFFEVHGSEFIVTGDDAARFAEIFHVATRRPMVNGLLNTNEPHGLRVIRRIISRLVGKAGPGAPRICFSVPEQPLSSEKAVNFHELLFRQVLADLGYDAKPISEGQAVVFGELASSNYTGVGISCGGGLCNICLSVLSLPVLSFSIPKAGDFIDTQTATATGESATRVRLQKEHAFQLNGFSEDLIQNVLSVYYDDVIRTLVAALRDQITSAGRLPKFEASIPLVLCGGTATPKGFLDRFESTLRAADNFPLHLSDIRLSSDPLNSTARGALVAALHESVRAEAAAA